ARKLVLRLDRGMTRIEPFKLLAQVRNVNVPGRENRLVRRAAHRAIMPLATAAHLTGRGQTARAHADGAHPAAASNNRCFAKRPQDLGPCRGRRSRTSPTTYRSAHCSATE